MGGSNITSGPAHALGNRSTSTIFQIVTVTASGNGSLLVVQRAIIVNFGLALANSGLNAAGGGALNGALPDTANAAAAPLDAARPRLELGDTRDARSDRRWVGRDRHRPRRARSATTPRPGSCRRVEGSVTGDDTGTRHPRRVGRELRRRRREQWRQRGRRAERPRCLLCWRRTRRVVGVPLRPHRSRRAGPGTRRQLPARLEPAPAPRRRLGDRDPARGGGARRRGRRPTTRPSSSDRSPPC